MERTPSSWMVSGKRGLYHRTYPWNKSDYSTWSGPVVGTDGIGFAVLPSRAISVSDTFICIHGNIASGN